MDNNSADRVTAMEENLEGSVMAASCRTKNLGQRVLSADIKLSDQGVILVKCTNTGAGRIL